MRYAQDRRIRTGCQSIRQNTALLRPDGAAQTHLEGPLHRIQILSPLPGGELNRILALKELGFSLEQVQTILLEEITLPQLKAMLHLKQTELEQEIEANIAQLALIEDRLNQLENGGGLEQITSVQPTESEPVPKTRSQIK